MAFSTTPEETLKYYLFKVMSEEDATRFMSLKEALAACEEQEPKWQAVYALSVHLYVLNSYQSKVEFRDYINEQVAEINNAKKLWAIVGKFVPKLSGHESYWSFLFCLYLGQFGIFYNQGKESEELLKDAIWEEMDSQRYPFIGYGKLMAANTLIPMLLKESKYKAAVEAMTKVAECLPIDEVFSQLSELVDNYLNHCVSIPIEQYVSSADSDLFEWQRLSDSPEGQWVNLIDCVAAIASIGGEISDESENRLLEAENLALANKNSEAYWAWNFGYIAGQLYKKNLPFTENLSVYCNANQWPIGTIVILGSLISGYNKNADFLGDIFYWFLYTNWNDTGLDLSEVAPTSGFYWAMRLGFAEAMREKAVAIVPPISPIEKLDKIETIMSSSFQWQIKGFEEMKGLLQAVTSRLPPSPEEIENYLLETLDDTFDRLPLQVIDHLKQAELDFKSGIRQSNARVEFVKSIEAALDCLFTSPLRSYYKQYKLGWPFMAPSPDGAKNEYGIRKWGEYFCKLAQPGAQQLGAVNTPSINHFLKEYYPNLNYCELEGLGKLLQDVQKLRGGSAHYQSQFPLHKEVEKLKELRKMVLGLEGYPSIIKQMVELFGSKRDTA